MVHLHGRTRAVLALILTTVLTVAMLGSTPSATAADTASISGRVTVSGLGISDVSVTAYRDGGGGSFSWYNSASTDSAGNYSVGTLPAGTYRLHFDAGTPSLAPEYFDNAITLATATNITVAEGAAVVGRNATLEQAAHITGKITGGGTNLRSIEVVAYSDSDADGEWESVAYTQTEFDGTYDLGGLSGGVYRLRFVDYSDDFVDEWYDDAVDLASADGVTVAKSATVAGINAVLTPTSHITGVVTGPAGAPLADIAVNAYALVDASWQHVQSDYTDALGTYDVGGLTEGSHRVEFRDWGGQHTGEFYNDKPDLASSDPVAVGVSATTSGINATLAPAAHITGRLTNPSGGGLEYADVYVYRLQGGTFEDFEYAEADGAGFYDVNGLTAGTYRLEFYDWRTNVSEFWNDKPNLQMADSIVLSTSQTVGNINAVVGPSVRSSTLPTITGIAQVGQTLTSSPGTWNRAGVSVAYQWLSGGTVIPGAVAATYVPTTLDYAKNLQVRVTASYPGWFPGTATSPSTAKVAAADGTLPLKQIEMQGRPVIKGTLEVGEKVRVARGNWRPDKVSLDYQWYAGSKKIKKATKRTLVLTTKQVGKKLTVKVTASRAGYAPLTVRTKPSARVKP